MRLITGVNVVLSVQAFREDRTLIAAADYIADALGQRFVESVPLNMERAWLESHPKCPLICLLSPGADPTKLIEVSLPDCSMHACDSLTAQAAAIPTVWHTVDPWLSYQDILASASEVVFIW